MMNRPVTGNAPGNSGEPFDRAVAAIAPRALAAREGAVRTDRALKELAREHPLLTLGSATLLGFLLGRLISRR